MKTFILILAIIGVINCYHPEHSDYDTPNLKKVEECETKHEISDEEKEIWWSWRIPPNPKKCYIECTLAAIGWINEKQEIDVSFLI